MPPTRVRVTSRHNQSVSLKCVSPDSGADRPVTWTVEQTCERARAAWSRDAGTRAATGLECAVSVCTERTAPTLSLRMAATELFVSRA